MSTINLCINLDTFDTFHLCKTIYQLSITVDLGVVVLSKERRNK